jgi:hypothetical protein
LKNKNALWRLQRVREQIDADEPDEALELIKKYFIKYINNQDAVIPLIAQKLNEIDEFINRPDIRYNFMDMEIRPKAGNSNNNISKEGDNLVVYLSKFELKLFVAECLKEKSAQLDSNFHP